MNEKQIEALKKIHATLGTVVGDDAAGIEMSVEKFLGYAQEQVTKAMSEPPEKGSPRLKALRGAIEKAVSDFGTMIASNTDSESIKVSVYTEQTTAGDELSSKEISLQTAAAGTGAGAPFTSFAMSKGAKEALESLDAVKKALGIAPAEGASEVKKGAEAKKPEPTVIAKNDGVDDEGWPDNLNDARYRETRKSATAPTFGYDSDPDANAAT